MKRMLQETLAAVGLDILHLIWVSLKEKESLPEHLWLPSGSHIRPCLCFCRSCPGALLVAHATGGDDVGVGGRHCYAGRSCHGGVCCRRFCPGGHYSERESTMALVRDAEAQAALAKREA
jgi:hypothetical protein